MRYVVEVADSASFTRAATRCFVTQSALSHQIAALERELGQRLFARTSRTVRVTEAGDVFLRHARDALQAAARAREEVASLGDEVTGVLRLGVIPTVTAVDVPELLSRYRAAHPRSRVEMRVDNSETLIEALVRGEIDVAFLGLRQGKAPAQVASHVLSSEQLVAVLPVHHRLADRGAVSLADFAGEVFADFPAGTSGREQADVAFASLGLHRDVAFEASSSELIIGLVRARLAIALLPQGVVPNADVVAVGVIDGPIRVEHVAWNEQNPRAVTRALLPLMALDES